MGGVEVGVRIFLIKETVEREKKRQLKKKENFVAKPRCGKSRTFG